VISVSIATIDYLAVVGRGSPIERLGREFVEHYGVEGGGLAVMAGVASSRLGRRRAHWGCVGWDEAGEAVIAWRRIRNLEGLNRQAQAPLIASTAP
jgi:sugar/nucleoside kinase (ribokinase family)